jgi:hypothetical protein
MRLQIGPLTLAQPMLACHLETMDHPVLPPQHAANRPRRPLFLAADAVGRWPNSSSSQPGPVGQSVCGTKLKFMTGRYRPVPGTCTGAGRSDPVDPVGQPRVSCRVRLLATLDFFYECMCVLFKIYIIECITLI